MCKLREEVEKVEQTGKASMIDKLAEVWTQFYTSILPTLLAFFASVQVCTHLPSSSPNTHTHTHTHTQG